MKIDIYTGYDKYFKRGDISIEYDRIIKINLYIPRAFAVAWSIEREAAIQWAEDHKEEFRTHSIFKEETDYKFSIKKLSRGSLPYRKEKLSHQLLSNDLSNYISAGNLYLKLSANEARKITFHLGKYVWQTKEFRKHIYFHITTYIISAALGVIGTLIFTVWTKKTKQQSNIQEKTMLNSLQSTGNLKNNTAAYDSVGATSQPFGKNVKSLKK